METIDQNRIIIKRALAGTENADFVYDKYVDLKVKSILNDLKTKVQADYIVMHPEELPAKRLLQLFKDYELGLIESLLHNLHLLLLPKEMQRPFQELIAKVTSHLSQQEDKKKRFCKQLDYYAENKIDTIDEFIGQLLLSLNPDAQSAKGFFVDPDYSSWLKLILFKRICDSIEYHAAVLDYILYAVERGSQPYSYKDVQILLETYVGADHTKRDLRCKYAIRKFDQCYTQNPLSRSTYAMQRLLSLFGSTIYLLFFPVRPPSYYKQNVSYVRPLLDTLFIDPFHPSTKSYQLDPRQATNLLRTLLTWRFDQATSDAVRFVLKSNYIYKADIPFIYNTDGTLRFMSITKSDETKKKAVIEIAEALKTSRRQGEVVSILQQYHDSEFNAMLLISIQHDKYMWRLWDAILATKSTDPQTFQDTLKELSKAYFRNKLPYSLVYKIQKYQPKK